ncbi:enoyl-CoA delta isomerase 1, mitochondrial-like [Drosophila bipectinata]|uniref:enoyl-CoA delta isomerase 1, mitochondrial-like n=1 Tax=Drosophila bipectinata TaxID=42026 RepID=UPI001C8927F0|nr:enoyl-CoA delta isomerase 1, mitochondrial-like [Drosophila bipectinata]
MLHLNLIRLGACRFPSRLMSTKFTSVEINDKTGVAILTLCRPPVNSANAQMLRDIKSSIDEIENNKSKGLIITSGSDKIFSAGLDVLEIYKADKAKICNIWTELQNVWLALYGSSLPTAAAINGHAPAGGCALAIACEYRAMVPNCVIGLNETQYGLIAPRWLVSGYLNVLPQRVAERALTQGRLYSTDEALKEGLIDEIVNSKEEALEKCENFIKSFDKVNPAARSLAKVQFREANIKAFEKNRQKDLDEFVSLASRPEVQKVIGDFMEKNKPKK